MNLKLMASFGDHVPEAKFSTDDTIEQLSFSQCDRFVASGDRAGRINLYRIRETGRPRNPLSFALAHSIPAFTKHFDPLSNDDVLPRITSIQWLPRIDYNPKFLTANRIFLF
jgi:hypothetical protein